MMKVIAFFVLFASALAPVRAGLQHRPLPIPDGQAILFTVHAEGVQIYESRPQAADVAKFEWAFVAPEATLYDGAHRVVGKHSAGPTWTSSDGSSVVGEKVASSNAPDPKDIPWLLLKRKAGSGTGVMQDVSYVLRVDTIGGAAPTKAPSGSNKTIKVKYQATYVFLTASPQ